MISLQGKVSLITGGSRGIGAGTAIALAKAGSHIAINYLCNTPAAESVSGVASRFGITTLLHEGDISRSDVAKELVDCVIRQYGRIDVVVNNAGIWTHGELGDMSDEVWDSTIDTNLKSVFNVCNAAVPHLKRQGGGRIINVASTAGQRGEAFHSHYAASKGGIIAFTKSLAVELARHHILVNAVAPGWVDTEMNDAVFGDKEFRHRVEESIPLRRIATAEDVAGAVLYLASDLSAYVTGATINVNGGAVLA